MKDKKKLEELLKVIKRVYDKNSGMQEVIEVSMIKVCDVLPEQVFFILLLFLS